MSKSTFLKLLPLAALSPLLQVSIAVAAGDPREIPGYPLRVEAYDSREVAMLPRYCKHTQSFRERVPGGNNDAEIKRLYEVLGPTFHAMHHYCWGLMNTNRALYLSTNKHGKAWYLTTTIGDFDYVIDRAPANFPLLPEILTKKGENLIRLGRGAAAVKELQRAIELKSDYGPPYLALSDYYKESGDLVTARELLESVASFAPEAPGLKRRLAALDGAKAKSSQATSGQK
jgi:tetratricopeptide (TPR) repeat protein